MQQTKKVKIQWYQYFTLGAFMAGQIVNALMEKRDANGRVISEFGVVTKDETQAIIDGLLEQVAALTGIDEIKVI